MSEEQIPTTDRRATRIVIADDHELVRKGIMAFFETQEDLEIVGEAAGGAHALRLVAELCPEVVLVDLVMTPMDGIELTKEIRRVSPTTAVIVLTSFHREDLVLPAIRAGARSYLLKDLSAEDLADAVRRTSAGETVMHPLVAGRVVRSLQGARTERPNLFRELTPRELEVLQLMAAGGANREIGDALSISDKTVKRHVGNILAKLQVSDRTKAAVIAWEQGLVRREFD